MEGVVDVGGEGADLGGGKVAGWIVELLGF